MMLRLIQTVVLLLIAEKIGVNSVVVYVFLGLAITSHFIDQWENSKKNKGN